MMVGDSKVARRGLPARALALLLAVLLGVSLMPYAAFAQETGEMNRAQDAHVQAPFAVDSHDVAGARVTGDDAGEAGVEAADMRDGEAAVDVAREPSDAADDASGEADASGEGAVGDEDTEAAAAREGATGEAGAPATAEDASVVVPAKIGANAVDADAIDEDMLGHEARAELLAQHRDQKRALLSASYDYSGVAHCWFRNDSSTDDVFDVEIDGVVYEAYCLDPGLPAPANGWYTFYATWNDAEKAYDIELDTSDAGVHWSQVDTGYGCQRVGGFRIYAKGNFTLMKSSTNLEVSGIYSVAGAVYGLYWYYADAQAMNEPDYRLVIGEDGASDTLTGLTPDECWYVRELEAPLGFSLDPQIYTVPIRPNQDNTYQVTDTPIMDPNNVLLKKITAEGQEYLGEHVSLALAEYQFDYYAGYYDTVEQARASGNPTRSWVLRTDEDGYTGIRFADSSFVHEEQKYSYLVSGEVYRAASGKPSMPFGTLVIYEINPPYGYKKSSSNFIGQLKPADNDCGYEWALKHNFFDGNIALDEERVDVGALTVLKESADPAFTEHAGAYSLAGARFDVYDNAACQGNPSYSLETKEDGTTDVIENLAPGSRWYIKEALPPHGFVASQTIYEAVIQPGSVAVTTVRIENAPVYAPAQVSLVKKDAEDNRWFKGDATLAGAEYTFKFYAGERSAQGTPDATWVGVTDAEGKTSLTDATLVAGSEWMIEGQRVLPLGFLTVEETKEPQGYLQSDEVFSAQLVYDDQTQAARWLYGDDASDSVIFHDAVAFDAYEDAKLFGISVLKEIQGAQDEISPEGIQFQIVYRKTDEVVKTLTLGADGTATTGERALPCGIYEVREVEESLPEGVLPYRETSGTGSNVIAEIDASDSDEFPLFQVVKTQCVDYTCDTPRGQKKDRDTGQAIAGTEFTLYRYNGEVAVSDGAVEKDAATLDPKQAYWDKIETVVTDVQGMFDFGMQPYGIYMVVETSPEWHYLSASEGEYDGASADPFETARIFVIDKNHPCEMQLWEDIAIRVECTVDKSTISVTSAGLVSKESSDAHDTVSNVGIEEYRYDVAFDNGASNTYADEYWVEDQLNMAGEPFGLRVTTIVLPMVAHDTDPTVAFLIRTNKSAGESWNPLVETAGHESTLCDGSARFLGAGWRFAGTYASDASTTISVKDLGLDDDEYLTGICLYYGAVEKGFSTIRPLSYMVVATHALPQGIVIPNTATSHITRNWANRSGEEGGLSDDAVDSVSTTVLGTFEQRFDRDYPKTSGGYLGTGKLALPQTGDMLASVGFYALIGALFAAACLILARRNQNDAGFAGKELAMKRTAGKVMGIAVAGLLLAVPLVGCSCSRQGDEAALASSSSSSALSAASAASDALSEDELPGEDETLEETASNEGGSSAASHGASSYSHESDGYESASLGDGSSETESSSPQPSAHEHSWEWVPQWVEVVDAEAYDEPFYRWATWCPTCGCEVSDNHNKEMMMQGEDGHTLTDLQVIDHYEHHEAETHLEDRGFYRCTSCGATE